MKVVTHFSHSNIAASLLKSRTNKSVIMPVVTRWSYLALTYGRVIELFDEINQICNAQKWDPISAADRDIMKDVLKLVEPFKEVTNKLQSATISTLSFVFPAISSLIRATEVIFNFMKFEILTFST